MAWELDAAHSLIEFSAKHMMVTTVKGRFTKHSGVLELDEQNPSASKADVTIDVNSLYTGDEKRDAHLLSADFFDVEKYPTITYKSTKVEEVGDNHFRITGDLTIHGVTKEVVLDANLEGQATNPWGKRIAAFTLHTSVNRKDYGLNWNVALEAGGVLVSDKVNINIEAQAVEVASAAA
ncbi:MAG TPA: YceI family protein [Ktedonobacterales bacterium]